MNEPLLTSEEVGKSLHPVFDTQIINYGAYNLVFATGSAIYRNPDIAGGQKPEQNHFLIGYRELPQEVIVAPVELPAVSAAGFPTSIDNTNALRAYAVGPRSLGLESTNGTSFILRFQEKMEVTTSAGSGILDQHLDLEDFFKFLETSWLEPFED